MAKIFGLSLGCTSEFIEKVLPKLTLTDWAEGWFAIPSVKALAARFFKDLKDPALRSCEAVKLVLAKIAASRNFYNYREGEIPEPVSDDRSHGAAMDLIMAEQKGDILIVPGQFGMRHRGRSVRRAREAMTHPEFGFGSVAVALCSLTHPERLVSYDDLGSTFREMSSVRGAGRSRVRRFHLPCRRGAVRYARCRSAYEYCGSASGAIPQ